MPLIPTPAGLRPLHLLSAFLGWTASGLGIMASLAFGIVAGLQGEWGAFLALLFGFLICIFSLILIILSLRSSPNE